MGQKGGCQNATVAEKSQHGCYKKRQPSPLKSVCWPAIDPFMTIKVWHMLRFRVTNGHFRQYAASFFEFLIDWHFGCCEPFQPNYSQKRGTKGQPGVLRFFG